LFCQAFDPEGETFVIEWFLDDVSQAQGTDKTVKLSTNNLSLGLHEIRAVMTDQAGNSSEDVNFFQLIP